MLIRLGPDPRIKIPGQIMAGEVRPSGIVTPVPGGGGGFAPPDLGVYDFTVGTHVAQGAGPLEPTCGGTVPWETSSGGCNNRHRWNGTELAFDSFWDGTTTDDYEPVYILWTGGSRLQVYCAMRFKLTAAIDFSGNTNQKIFRHSNPNRGVIYGTGNEEFAFWPDVVRTNDLPCWIGISQGSVPSWVAGAGYTSYASNIAGDGQYHELEWEIDHSGGVEMFIRFWWDGVPIVQPAGAARSAFGDPASIPVWRDGGAGEPSDLVYSGDFSGQPMSHVGFHEEASGLPMNTTGSLFLQRCAYSTQRIGPGF